MKPCLFRTLFVSRDMLVKLRTASFVFMLMAFILSAYATTATADISGLVTNSAGAGIAGVWVSSFDAASGQFLNSATTQANGSYTLSSLPTGNYKLQFDGNNTGYLTQWYNNKPTQALADSVTVTAEATTSGIDASMIQGGSISGLITNSAGTGIGGVFVESFDAASGQIGRASCR